MYFAGLDNYLHSLNHEQGMEGLALLATCSSFIQVYRSRDRNLFTSSPVKNMPDSQLANKLILPVQVASSFAIPLIHLVSVSLNNLQQPEWLSRFALPDQFGSITLSVGTKAWLRTGACLGTVLAGAAISVTFKHLGPYWHFIGVREKARVVTTGPYAYVRHPIYSLITVASALQTIMYWSYLPLVALGIFISNINYKIKIEENLIEEDPLIGLDYKEYKESVKWKVIPFIW